VALTPHFNEPYRSASLRDFWGRRWNVTASTVLRHAVFEPTRSATGSTATAVLAAFAVSGAVHEVLLLYCTREWRLVTWEWLAFFSLHGLLMVGEEELARRCFRRRRHSRGGCAHRGDGDADVPSKQDAEAPPVPARRGAGGGTGWLATLATLGVLLSTAELLFWPPVERGGLDRRLLGEWEALLGLASAPA
jgi:hypothetical protein